MMFFLKKQLFTLSICTNIHFWRDKSELENFSPRLFWRLFLAANPHSIDFLQKKLSAKLSAEKNFLVRSYLSKSVYLYI
jgi:hypothetical protein